MKKKFDLVLFITVIVLILFGLVMIYSASSIWAEYKFHDAFKYVKQQSLFIAVGIVLMIIVSKIDYKYYQDRKSVV